MLVQGATNVVTNTLAVDALDSVGVSAENILLKSSESLSAMADGPISVVSEGLSLQTEESARLSTLGKLDVLAAKSVAFESAADVKLRANEDVHVSAAGAMVLDARTAVEVSTQDASITSDATVRALAGDAAVLGAETLSVQASEKVQATVGSADLTVGESVLVRSGADFQVSAGGAVTTATSKLQLQATEAVDVLGSDLNVVGSDGINIETHGAMFRMIHGRPSDTVSFVWTKPVYFDEAEVLLEKPIRRTDRLWIEKGGPLSPAARRSDTASTALGKVFLDLYSEEQQRWVGVWSAPLRSCTSPAP